MEKKVEFWDDEGQTRSWGGRKTGGELRGTRENGSCATAVEKQPGRGHWVGIKRVLLLEHEKSHTQHTKKDELIR